MKNLIPSTILIILVLILGYSQISYAQAKEGGDNIEETKVKKSKSRNGGFPI